MNHGFNDPRIGIDLEAFRRSISENGIEKTRKAFHIGRVKILEICRLEGIAVPRKGRPVRQISSEELQFCLKYKDEFHVGYQRAADAAKRHNIHTSEWNVRKIFEQEELFCYQKPTEQPNEHPRLFVAKYAGQLWHADIHYVTISGGQFYLLGFIDDRTRFLLYYEVLSSKTSDDCAQALTRALGIVTVRPKMLTIDNGGEFTGNPFQTVLAQRGIEDYRTHPYTPEENGKIERFWLTIERAKGPNVPWSIQKINEIIHEYNFFWSHRSLRMLTKKPTTPSEAWSTMPRYSGQADACIEMIK